MLEDPAIAGRVLGGRYRVSSFLGEGAMARVYRATPTLGGQDVAVKVMHPDLAEDPTFMRRFRREAKAAACLQHPNVVQVIDFGVDGDLAYIAMELLEGSDLFDILADEGRLGQARTVRLMLQVCAALQHAHDRGIIHRDLKPENVMVLSEPPGHGAPRVKVLDFGIAKVHQRERAEDMPSVSGSALTNVGSALGTPEYMSPEQCEGIEVDARSDVYTCGGVLYRMLVGRVPFAGSIALDTMLRHLRDPPRPPRELVPELDPALEAIVLRALAKQPDDRPQTAGALGAELAALLPALDAREAARPLRPPPSVPPRPARRGHSPRTAPPAVRGAEARPLAVATGDTDPDTIPSQRTGGLRSYSNTPVAPPATAHAAVLRTAAAPPVGTLDPAPASHEDVDALDAEVPTDVDLLGSAERLVEAGLPSDRRGDPEDDTLVMPGRESDPGEGVLTTPFIAAPRASALLPAPGGPPALAPVMPPTQPLAPRPSAPALPGNDGVAAPIRVAPLFFITFSIVLAIGMALLRWARPF
jgi:serine/threonine-protein kinase